MSEETDRRILGALIVLLAMAWILDAPATGGLLFVTGMASAVGLLVAVTGEPVVKTLVDRVRGR